MTQLWMVAAVQGVWVSLRAGAIPLQKAPLRGLLGWPSVLWLACSADNEEIYICRIMMLHLEFKLWENGGVGIFFWEWLNWGLCAHCKIPKIFNNLWLLFELRCNIFRKQVWHGIFQSPQTGKQLHVVLALRISLSIWTCFSGRHIFIPSFYPKGKIS